MGFASKEQLQDLMEFMGNNLHVPQLVQHFNGENIYTTDEQIIGCWLDGRPLYKKVIIKNVPANSTADFAPLTEIPNLKDLIRVRTLCSDPQGVGAAPLPFTSLADGSVKNEVTVKGRNMSENYMVYTCKNNVSRACNYYFICQYTKSTDAANSYNIAKENTYNLTEKVVGKWVDGSTLYQKTIEMGVLTNASSAEDTKTALHGISNLNKVVSATGHWYLTANPTTGGAIPYYDKNYYISTLTQSGNNVAVNYKGNWSTATAFVTIQYTKTS